jgi:cytoskeleton protein RodZ
VTYSANSFTPSPTLTATATNSPTFTDSPTPTPAATATDTPTALPTPVLISVSQDGDATGGGWTITVTGTGFLPGAVIYLDGVPLTTTVLSGGVLTAAAPAHAAGSGVITVGNAGGVSFELNGRALPPLGARGVVIPRLVLPPESR